MAKEKKTKKSRSLTRDIRKAVDSIPEILADRIARERQEDAMHERAAIAKQYEETRGKRRILVAGVALFASAVLGMWLWNAKTMMARLFASESAEAAVVARADADIDAAIATAAAEQETLKLERERKERTARLALEERIRRALAAHVAAAIATSTPTTTQEENL